MTHRLLATLLFACMLFVGPAVSLAQTDDPAVPLRVLVDVRSDHSDGAHDFTTLIEFAKKRGIEVLAFTEHDRYSIRLGLEPVPQFVGYAMQHPSLYVTGVDKFFSDLAAVREQHPEMIFMAGTESTPGYTWTGFPPRDLSLVDAERHIITLGEEKSEQVQALPSFDLRHAHGPFKLSMLVWWVVAIIVIIVLIRKRQEALAVLLFAGFVAFLVMWMSEEPKIDADVDFITKAKEQGLFTIWTHPGTLSGVRPGPFGIKLDTPPYSEKVFKDPTAQAFAAIYGDTDTNTVPGGPWDNYLIEYMLGAHPAPIWAMSCGDYHEEGQSGEYLGNFPMDVWAEERSPQGVLKALRAGHAVAWRAPPGKDFKVRSLYLEDAKGRRLLPGDEAVVAPDIKLHLALDGKVKLDAPVLARLIINGRVQRQMAIQADGLLDETVHLDPGEHVVRIDIPAQPIGTMIANPFLLRVK